MSFYWNRNMFKRKTPEQLTLAELNAELMKFHRARVKHLQNPYSLNANAMRTLTHAELIAELMKLHRAREKHLHPYSLNANAMRSVMLNGKKNHVPPSSGPDGLKLFHNSNKYSLPGSHKGKVGHSAAASLAHNRRR